MRKVVVYKSPDGRFWVIEVPDSYQTGQERPAPRTSAHYAPHQDTDYADKASALADACARNGGDVLLLDECDSDD